MPGIDSYTKLMLHCDGINGSTSFPDDSDSAHVVTANGDAQVSTAQQKFGTGSSLFDRTGDFLSIPDSDDFSLNGVDYTIDFWARPDGTGGLERQIIGQRDGGGDSHWFIRHTTAFTFQLRVSGDTKISVNGSTTVVANTWYHVALVKDSSGNYKLFVNGNEDASGSYGGSWENISAPLTIGKVETDSATFGGYLDEIRLSQGVQRWTAGFTPPTQAYDSQAPPPITKISGGGNLVLDGNVVLS